METQTKMENIEEIMEKSRTLDYEGPIVDLVKRYSGNFRNVARLSGSMDYTFPAEGQGDERVIVAIKGYPLGNCPALGSRTRTTPPVLSVYGTSEEAILRKFDDVIKKLEVKVLGQAITAAGIFNEAELFDN